MPLEVISLRPDLFEQAATITYTCFDECAAFRVCFPNGPSPTSIAFAVDEIRKETQGKCAGPNPTAWHICIIDGDNPSELLAYAAYYLEQPHSQEEDNRIDKPKPAAEYPVSSDANAAAYAVLKAESTRHRREFMQSHPKYLFLAMLATAEKARGRGAAKMMVEWVKRKAKELQVPCYLSALQHAAGLYERNGWRMLGFDERHVSPWIDEKYGTAGKNIPEEDVHTAMVLDS